MKKLRASDELTEYLLGASEEDGAVIEDMFSSLESRLNLASVYERGIMRDYDRALVYLLSTGVSPD